MAIHIPKPSKLFAHGSIDTFERDIDGIIASFNGNKLAQDYSCGFWILYKYKCAMSDNPECWVITEVARDRTCQGELQGFRRLVPPGRMNKEREGEEEPKTGYRVDWILGGILVSYAREIYDGWRCGDLHQPPDSASDTRNEYIGWFIRIYDFVPNQNTYEPFMVDDPSSPNPTPPKCSPATRPPAEPVIYEGRCSCHEEEEYIDCNGVTRSTDWITWGPTEDPEEAIRLEEECNRTVAEDAGYRAANHCDCEGVQRKPSDTWVPPLIDELPDAPWSPGGGGVSQPKPGGNVPPPPIWSTPSNEWGDTYTSPGGPSPPGGWGGWYVPPTPPIPLPKCYVLVKVNCDGVTPRNLRKICVEKNEENEYGLPACSEVQVPLKQYKLDFGDGPVTGLEDATYFIEK